MIRYRTVIFDFDGTLYDTICASQHCFNLVCAYYQLPPVSVQEAFRLVGPPFHEIIRRIYPEATHEEISELLSSIKTYYLQDGNNVKEFAGVSTLLRQLYTAGVNLCVASMKEQEILKQALTRCGVQDLFTSVHGFWQETPDKGGAIKKCIQDIVQKGKPVGNAVMVGDNMSDWVAARENHMDFIAATYGYGLSEKQAKGLDCCICYARNIEDIRACLLGETDRYEKI